MSTKQTKCVFCNSTSYGKNCPYSHFKSKIHLHTGDPSKCSFCGSSVKIGPGCPNSPSGKHMAGANFFNSMVAESFLTGLMMHSLSEKIVDTYAYKLGLINEMGNIIKKAETLEETMAFTAVDSYLLKLKKLLGNKIDLLNNEIYLEAAIKTSEVPIELYEKEIKLKSDLQMLVKRFYEMVEEAHQNNLPITVIEKLIIETLK
jgi:hypothetical protein